MIGFAAQPTAYTLQHSSPARIRPLLPTAQSAITLPRVLPEPEPAPLGARLALRTLMSELSSAAQFAARAHFDPPSPFALERARTVLSLLAIRCTAEAMTTDVAVAEDGMVEITALKGTRRYTVEIPSGGSRVEIIAQDAESGALLGPSVATTEQDAVDRIERAA